MTPALKPMDEERKVVLVVISKFRTRKHDRNITSTQMMLAPITQARSVVSTHTSYLKFVQADLRTNTSNTTHHPTPVVIWIEHHIGGRCAWEVVE